ncbi:MAG: acyltransferase family protein [Solirubrobacterales bacterium]
MSRPQSTEGHDSFFYRPALDGLRALAVVAVIGYHLDYGIAKGGFLGVDLFFVLSGYLITSLLVAECTTRGRISISSFWARRVRRLLPGLIPPLLAVLLYAAVVADPLTQWSLRLDAFASLFYFANWHFIFSDQSYFAQYADPSPLRHFWSLAIEEQFYLVWPGLVAVLLWLGRPRVRFLAAAALLGTFASVAAMALLWSANDPSPAYYSTFSRAHELLVGALLALLLSRNATRAAASRMRGWSPAVVGISASLAVLLAFGIANDQTSAYYYGGSMAFCLAVALLIAAVERPGLNPVRDALSVSPARYVGRISYSLYLWHWPVIIWLNEDRVPLSGAALDGLRIAVMVSLAALSTHLLEEPIRRGEIRDYLTPRRLVFAVPALSGLVVLAIIGATRGAQSPESATYVTVTAPAGVADSKSSGDPPVIALFGDSVPRLLEPALTTVAESGRSIVINAAVTGCAVTEGLQADTSGEVVPWQQTCETTAWPNQARVIDRYNPDVVVWYSATENTPRIIDGESFPPGTAAHREDLRAALEVAYERLTARGATLIVVRVPLHGIPPEGCESLEQSERCATDEAANATVPYINAQLEWLANRHSADTRLISLDDVFCPSGSPCPSEIDGLPVRPDGSHFSPEFAPQVARALLDRVVLRQPH